MRFRSEGIWGTGGGLLNVFVFEMTSIFIGRPEPSTLV